MAIITLPYRYLEQLVGTDHRTILSRLPMLGSDIERIEEDHADVEFFPDRPDLFSPEGVARAMRGFLGIETGLPEYPVRPSGIGFTIDPQLAGIRPYLGSAVIRNLSFDEESIQSLMSLQEALHWAVGRGRSKVAIGIHDLARITPPFHYLASPKSRCFIPLDYEEEMTLDEILRVHPKGRQYASIVNTFPLYPLIVDDCDRVLSFPPIINGELTRVTSNTRDILLDTTGTDIRAVQTAVNIICTALIEAGAEVESVTIGGEQTPDLSPSARMVSAAECSELLGIDLNPEVLAGLLERMRFGATPAGHGMVRVQVPCFRSDIMHDWDVFEDAAIAYGYENIACTLPGTFTVGRAHPVQIVAGFVRQICTGLGYLEVIPFTLTNERVMYTLMQRPVPVDVLRIMHPISEEHTMVRTALLPLLIEMCRFNRHRELPQRLFASGDVITGNAVHQQVACVSIHPGADFSEAYACADALCRELSISMSVEESRDPAFIGGRCGRMILEDDRYVGVFGEIHPAVLNDFELEHPVAAVEIDLRAVPGYPSRPDTP